MQLLIFQKIIYWNKILLTGVNKHTKWCIHVAFVEVRLLHSCWLLHFRCTAKRNKLSEEEKKQLFSLFSQVRLQKKNWYLTEWADSRVSPLEISVSLSDERCVHSVGSLIHVGTPTVAKTNAIIQPSCNKSDLHEGSATLFKTVSVHWSSFPPTKQPGNPEVAPINCLCCVKSNIKWFLNHL